MDISFIIPVYNSGKFLRRCIESISNQGLDGHSYEILVVNDGSTDESAQICDEVALDNPNVVVFHKKNGGVSSARNEGLKLAKGAYVAFVDSDDWLEKETFLPFLSNAIKEDLDVSFSNMKVYTDHKHWHIDFQEMPTGCIFGGGVLVLKDYKVGSVCTSLFKRKFLEKYAIEFPLGIAYGEDSLFMIHALVFAQRVMFFEGCYYVYYYNEFSATQNLENHDVLRFALNDIKIIKELMKIKSGSNDLQEKIRKRANSIFIGRLYSLIKDETYDVAATFLQEAIHNDFYPIKGGTLGLKSTLLLPLINSSLFRNKILSFCHNSTLK